MKKIFLLSALCVALCGCGTSAEPTYYTLAPVQGAVAPDLQTVIEIRRPNIPNYLDRPQFVTQDSSLTVSIDQTSYWAEPLDKMIARVLEADLQQRLPHSLIVTEDTNESRDIPFHVDLIIQKFNALASGVALEGELTLSDEQAGTHDLIPVTLTSPSSGNARTTAAGLSEILGALADTIVGNLKVKAPSP